LAALVSPCSIFDCNTCEHYAEARCPGCPDGNAYLEKRGLESCKVSKCVAGQQIESCNDCTHTSCDLSRDTDLTCPLRSQFENRRWWAGRLARALGDRKGPADENPADHISDRTIDRMRWYLAALDAFAEQGVGSVSSWQLAQRVGVKAPLIRKDLSRFGEFGTPSLGYDVKYLRKKILDILKLNETRYVAWIGAKKLRDHHGEIQRICHHNCHLVAVLDPDPAEVGERVADVQVMHLDALPQVLSNLGIDLAVLGIDPDDAQAVATILARGGVSAILNLTSALLSVPDHITVRNMDIGGELLALSYYCGKKDVQGSAS
jgi:redox-sensing transcriptional repressor